MRKHTLAFTPLLLLPAMIGCGGTEFFAHGTERAPRAQLEITYDHRTVAGNFPLSVEVDRLPPPDEIGENYRRFAVWAIPEGESQPRLTGFLDYDSDARSGRLETVTPYNAQTILVTAERPGTPNEPSAAVVAGRSVDYAG